jgi:hypothetical protein
MSMPSQRKFYKTTLVVEILSEEPEYEFDPYRAVGDSARVSCDVKSEATVELDGPAAAKALIDQRSDSEFFELDEEGNDLDD